MAKPDDKPKREPRPETFYFRIVSGRKRIDIKPNEAKIEVKTGKKRVNIG